MMEELLYPQEPARFTSMDIEDFIKWAIKNNASDITIQNEERIFCEIYNHKVWVTKRKLSRAELSGLISFIYNDGGIAKLNSGHYVDFTWSFMDGKYPICIRGNITSCEIQEHIGYSISLRILNEYRPPLASLDLPSELLEAIDTKKGMIIVSGATGSGKSTLLACIIDNKLENPDSHLKMVTFESPIEYTFHHILKPSSIITQSEVPRHVSSYAEGIRSTLRRKADAIFLGELRDLETTREALRAVQKGHLLLSTTHSNSCADTIHSLINEFPVEEKSARSIQLINLCRVIISQILANSTDGKRVAIREYLIMDSHVRKRIQSEGVENVAQTIQAILKERGTDFMSDASLKLYQGLISEETYQQIIRDIYE